MTLPSTRATTFCIAVLVVTAWAVDARAGWRSWSTGDGLANNYVFVVTQSADGAMWLGTLDGASRFDGSQWTVYRSGSGLADARIQTLLADPAEGLWAGTDRGLYRWDGARWTAVPVGAAPGPVNVLDLARAPDGALWLATTTGVLRRDGSAWTAFGVADGLPAPAAYCIEVAHDGTVWVGTDNGYASFDGTAWRGSAQGLADKQVRAIRADRNGALWFGTLVGGVSRFDAAGWRTFVPPEAPPSATVLSIDVDSAGVVWFGTLGGGISRYDGASWASFGRTDGLAGDDAMAVFADADGAIWVATEEGVSRFDDTYWRSYAPPSLGAALAVVVCADRERGVWIGTWGGGLSRFDGRSWTTWRQADGLLDDTVLAILQDAAGELWLGQVGGVSRFDGSTWQRIPAGTGLGGGYVQTIAQARDGALWFGTGRGVSRFDGAWRTYSTADGLPDTLVYALMEDDRGRIWAGTRRGVWIHDGDAFRVLTSADGLAADPVMAMVQDRAGVVWLGGPSGLSRSDGAGWRVYRATDGLGSDIVQALALDRDGVLWAGTLTGASRFDGERWLNLRPSDGLAGPAVQSVALDSTGTVWFATDAGVSALVPDRVPPRTVVTSAPRPVSPTVTPAAAYVPAFGEERVQFLVRLDGVPQGDWSPANAWFHGLMGDGDYGLDVRARDEFGNVESRPWALRFTIDATPPRPGISSPAYGAAIGGAVAVRGTAADARSLGYQVLLEPVPADPHGVPVVLRDHSVAAAPSDTLATFDSRSFADGFYTITVEERDSLGLTGVDAVVVQIDNQFPPAVRTSPATVSSREGGEVFAIDGTAHLYFAPGALDRDAGVVVAAGSGAPDSLADGARRVSALWRVGWEPAALLKPAEFDLVVGAGAGVAALHRRGSGGDWVRIGGTLDRDQGRLHAFVTEAGDYAVFTGASGAMSATSGLSPLVFVPRVLTASATGAAARLGIGFSLGAPGPVSVSVHNRAGRLVRQVLRSVELAAGSNVVYWDGRGEDGGLAPDGLYVVSVESREGTRKGIAAVVR